MALYGPELIEDFCNQKVLTQEEWEEFQFAPNMSLQEEFIHHWKAITSYFVDNKVERGHVEQTQIPGHLDQMMRILYEEELEAQESGTTGPCLEYVLQHKLMETLYTLGRTDHPPGMKQIILSFFTKMLSRIKHPLLPHINVHRAIQRMVKTCGEVRAAPTEKEEIEFLCTVCAKIKTDPYLVNFFIEACGKSQRSPGSSTPQSTVIAQPASLEFCLVDALIALSQSADARISVKACEGLMLCASLPEETAAKCIIADTRFSPHLTERLCELYDNLPTVISPADIDSVDAKWGLDVFTQREDHQSFIGKRTLISFVSWLDYCDQLISIANPLVACALSTAIHEHLLKGKMQPRLLQPCETGAIMATAYLARCLKTVSSKTLLTEFTHFVLGNETGPEVRGEGSHKLRKTLIDRCNHISEEMCLSTLKLFDILLQKEDVHIYQNLFLRNLLGRGYLKVTTDGSLDSNSETVEGTQKGEDESAMDGTTEEESQDENKEEMKKDNKEEIKDEEKNEEMKKDVSSSYVKPEVHKIVNSFLMVLPEDAKSSYQTADSGYDMYLRDATRQFTCIDAVFRSWKWPVEAVQMDDYKCDMFYEGDFLHMLMNRLSSLLKQTYSINLVLTSVIARVAHIPHPNLHEYLLDPFLPVNTDVHTLPTVLRKVANEIETYLKTEPHFSDKLVVARKQLLGIMDTIHSVRNSLAKSDPIGFDDQSQLEAIIVMEEFCKELSAIAFVKHHAAVTRS